MGKKNKKEKGRGAEKTAQKMLKKQNKGKKDDDLDDLEAMIAQFKEADKKKTTFNEEKVSHPSARLNMSVCAHPDKDELLIFGGEYYNGKKITMFNDLFVYNIKKNEWLKRFVPNPPSPRSAHQAVVVSKEGGQMWIFGGEFSSPNNSQFHHFKDLFVLNLKKQEWKQVKSANGPSPRSGHRMCVHNRNIFVFGGFHESTRDFIYFNDCYSFNINDHAWTKIVANGSVPSPRSACQLALAPNGILVVGGYSKTRLKKDVEKGTAHTDMYLLSHEANSKWKWSQVKQSGQKPWPRSGFSITQISQQRAVLFGGCRDEDEEENIQSQFFNSMSCLDVVSNRWFNFELRNSKKDENSEDDMDHDGGTSSASGAYPCPRLNAAVVMKKGIMYLYGGMLEHKDQQITLNDLWAIDVKKVDAWKELVKSDDTAADWQEEASDADSDSEEDEEGGGDNEEKSVKQQQSIDWGDQDLPKVRPNDNLPSFWFRTREEWLELVSMKLEDDEGMRADEVAGLAEMEAKKYYQGQQQKKSEVEEMEI